MRIVGKLIRFSLLFILFLVCAAAVLLQTQYVQEKLVTWVEKETHGALKIGKLKGVLPFWVHLQNVSYRTNQINAQFDSVKAVFLPTSLLWGRIALANLQIDHAEIDIVQNANGKMSIPVDIHSLSIQHLTIQDIQDISISGMASFDETSFMRLTITHPKLAHTTIAVTAQTDPKNKTFSMIGHIKNLSYGIENWIDGTYTWDTETFTGWVQSVAKHWQAKGRIELVNNRTLASPDLSVTIAGYSIEGSFAFDLNTHKLTSSGIFLDHSFILQTTLNITEESISATALWLCYNEEILTAELQYGLKDHKLTGSMIATIRDLSRLPIDYQLAGSAEAKLIFLQDAIRLRVEALQLAWKDLYIPHVSFEGAWQNKQLAYALNFHDFVVLDPAYEVFPNVHLDLRGTATAEHIDALGHIWGLGEAPFTLSCELPIRFSFSDLVIDHQAPFSMRIQGKGSIDPVLAFLENASLIARGSVDIDLAATGTWDEPELVGYLHYDNGWIESFTTGALFRDISMKMEGDGKKLQIRSLMAHDVARGDLVGFGELTWDPQGGFPFSFNVFTSRYLILARDPFTASVDAEINLSGTIHGMTITGKARLVEGYLSIPGQMPVQVPILDVCYLNPLPTPKPEEQLAVKTIPVHWDLLIEAPSNFTIEGRGLDSQWCGMLHIQGEQNALTYTGNLQLLHGRFVIINKTFDLVRGDVRIDGLDPKDIYIDLKGDYELPNLTASILLMGTLDNTHFSFCSNPPMNTNQILSWLIFQQDINELTPFQACRLAALLVSLSGKYSGPKTFDRIKERLGIDVFSITDCDIDSADLTFQVGKYISEGTFVGINKSISGDFDSVLIQTRLFRNFYLEADYGGSLNGLTPTGGKVIFKWYKSY